MAPRLSAEFDFRALGRALRRLPDALDDELEACVRRAGYAMAAQARGAHDYTDRTGRLTASILPVAPTGRFSEDDDLEGGVGALAPYARFVEEGTPRMHQRGGYRFLAHALSSEFDDVAEDFGDSVESAVRRAGLG